MIITGRPTVINDVLDQFIKVAKEILGKDLVKVILYGSYARGDYRENSDLDLMLLTTLNDNEIKRVQQKIFDAIYDLELEHFITISVIIKNIQFFEHWLGAYPFYDNVSKEGIVLHG